MRMDYRKELNENQFKAVTSNAQFLRIIAGAGSGKTRVLTYRIAYLIEHENVLARNILAITFTNKVANEMKERTIQLLNGNFCDGLSIMTFHSWCAKFLRREIEVLGFPRSFTILDDDDQLALIKSIGETYGYKRTDDKNKEALNFISFHKCYGRLPSEAEKFYGYLDNHKKEMITYFQDYERRKNEMHSLDFDDLLIYSINILTNYEEVRTKWVNYYRHILIDEFQDTNDLQFKLLKLLTGDFTNIYVVGDPDQTIYTWRGANQDIIMKFDNYYLNTVTIPLLENYRSTQMILDSANRLISNNKDRYKKDLYTNKIGGKEVMLKMFPRGYDEARFICKKILDIKQNYNVKYSDIAVLYRSNYLTNRLENCLKDYQIPYKVFGGLKFYQRQEVKDCLAYFKLFVNEDDDVAFERIVNVPRRKIGDASVSTLKFEANANNLSILKYIKDIHKYETKLKSNVIVSLNILLEEMNKTKERLADNNEAYSEVLKDFLVDIKYFDYLDEIDEEGDRTENVHELLNDIRNYLKNNPESKFDEYIQNVTLLSAQDDIDDSDSVLLMTAHTAKGLEFDYVFIMGLAEGVFPNNRALNENPKAIEEERRLCYVASTRARKELYLTYNTEFSYTSKQMLTASRFIKEMGLKVPSFNPYGMEIENNQRLYGYGVDNTKSADRSSNIIDLKPNNNIKWSIGDSCLHQAFGEGVVKSVEGDIIEVEFKDFGRKTLLGTHPKLSKKE